MGSHNLEIVRIGTVENEITDRMDANWGNVVSTIILDEAYAGGTLGLEDFSHILILIYLHEARYERDKHLRRRPRNRAAMPLLGIFSQRTKNRPNPIGVTAVELIEATDSFLIVKGLDAISGTPVLDIKPYYPHYDRIESARTPSWVDELMKGYF